MAGLPATALLRGSGSFKPTTTNESMMTWSMMTWSMIDRPEATAKSGDADFLRKLI